ncbi:DinB family protein [Planococcus soli]|uniref:DinB family protein n=1 Tax=Planococcus soli TaxID=2666072 RepID=UPI00115EC0F7|nr:DinB family protein [Planococcus soli]
MIDYRIVSANFYTEKIGELVSMLEHTRNVTLSEISELTQAELDYLPGKGANSVASLLLHIVSIEFVHQIGSFNNRELTESEVEKWGISLELGARARANIKEHSVDFYIDRLQRVRMVTLQLLESQSDSWLFEENKWGNGIPYNNYYLWFHVMEDEISHRGQIRTILRQLKNKQ